MKKKKFEVTTDTALTFSAIMLIIFTIVVIVMSWKNIDVPDTLIVAFFAAFGVAEGGYCTFIYKHKKKYGGNDNERTDDTDNN